MTYISACAQISTCAEETRFTSSSGFRSSTTILSLTCILPVKSDPTIFGLYVPSIHMWHRSPVSFYCFGRS